MPTPDLLENQPPREKPRVYLAGKISQHGWRERLTHRTIYPRDPLDPHEFVDTPNFICTGPFFANCGHGMAHVPATHGLGERRMRERVFNTCLSKIAQSDFVFAFLNEVDAHGTIFELGFAHAHGVPVYLNIGPDLTRREINDLWFPAYACRRVHGDLEQAFWNTLQDWRAACAMSALGGCNG